MGCGTRIEGFRVRSIRWICFRAPFPGNQALAAAPVLETTDL